MPSYLGTATWRANGSAPQKAGPGRIRCGLRKLAAEIADEIGKIDPARSVAIQVTVARRHPVESSCQRRRRGLRGLPAARHAIVAISQPPEEAAAYFLDNVITEGTTVAACRSALGHGNALVWAAK